MDEVITCPKCKHQEWVIGTSGTRCGKCNYWLEPYQVIMVIVASNEPVPSAEALNLEEYTN